MGQVGGYLLHERCEHATRAVDERVRDYADIALMPDDGVRREQAGRCMDCGVAFCQSGLAFGGTRHVTGCPLHNRIPEWNDLLWRGLWSEAYERLALTNPFPEFTGHVCPAPCEKACNLATIEGATTIRDNERAIAQRAFELGIVRPPLPRGGAGLPGESGRRIAVVGSGPAGLACAWKLAEAGHAVTVYDRAERPGGLLAHGIPPMKLPRDVVERRIELLRQAGVRFELGVGTSTSGAGAADVAPHGEEATNQAGETTAGSCAEKAVGVESATRTSDFDWLEALPGAYDAVVMAIGAQKARELRVPGAESAGVYLALDYLASAIDAALLPGDGQPLSDADSPRPAIDACGKHVVVIGGGDTGTDCLAMAVRQGAVSAVQLQYHPAPATHRAADNPWPTWPDTLSTEYGQLEAAWLDDRDDARLWSTDTLEVIPDESGHVCQLRVAQVEWSSGRPVPVPGTERLIPADLVLVARGFEGPEAEPFATLGIPMSEGARPRPLMREKQPEDAADDPFEAPSMSGSAGTTHPERWHAQGADNVFVAGDARCGASLVVHAIADGMSAAEAVGAWLRAQPR